MLIRRLVASPLKGVMHAVYTAGGRIGDAWLGIRTEDRCIALPEAIDADRIPPHARHADSNTIQPNAYWSVRYIIRALRLTPDDVFIDVGCGSGRVLCMAARHPIRRAIGVELFEEVCATARANAAALRGRKAPIEIIQADAAVADIPPGTVYYLANPFGAGTLADFLANLKNSLAAHPRQLRLCYVSPRHLDVVQAAGFLRPDRTLKTFGGSTVSIWTH